MASVGLTAARRRPLGRDAHRLIAAAVVSSAGDWIYRLALPLVVFELTHSAVGTAITYALEYAPYLLLSPLGGVLADRVDRRRLLITIDVAAGLLVGLVAALLWLDRLPVGAVYVVAFLVASLAPVRHPAFQALLPDVVATDDFVRMQARLQGGESVVGVAGPVLAGTAIATLGAAPALGLDAASFLACALGVRAVRRAPCGRAMPAGRGVKADLSEVVSYLRTDGVLTAGAAVFAGVNFAVFLVEANLIFALLTVHHVDSALIGVVFAAQGVGAVAGAAIAAPLGRRWPLGDVIIAGTFVSGLATLMLLAASTVAGISLAWGVESMCGTLTAVTWFSLRAARVPGDLLGRVVAVTRMLAFASIPAASLVGGALLSLTTDLEPLILTSGLLQLVLGAVALRTALHLPVARRSASALTPEHP